MFIAIRRSQLAVDLGVKADDAALSGVSDEPDLAALSRLEAGRGAGRDIEPIAARLFAVKGECGVGFVEVVMRADLDRAVACIGDGQRDRRAAGVELDVARGGEDLARDHGSTIPAFAGKAGKKIDLVVVRIISNNHS